LEMRKLFAIALAGVLARPAAAQTRAALATPDGETPAPTSLTIRRIVPEVQMVFAAEDHRGRPVLGLSAPQIRVLDHGIAAPLTSFRAAAGMPLRLALLLDTSDSMRPGFAAARQAALAFLRRAQGSADNQIFALLPPTRGPGQASASPARSPPAGWVGRPRCTMR
jgi:hypothetical protein